ncbi:MAG: hypothetical protein ACXVZZ_08650 [Terriglobales bacterium]
MNSTRIAPATCTMILLGILAPVIATVACSKQPVRTASAPAGPTVRPAVLQTSEPVVPQPAAVVVAKKTTVKPSAFKLLLYKSRDYGVSFEYPWQYSFVNAKALASGDPSLRPASDGHDGQITLARVEIPKGFYSDTDYQSGYFTLSLNQNLTEEQCYAVLSPGKDGKVETDTINDLDFRWMETDSGGHGQASKLRQYVAFANSACYELELGVKSSNENGLSREVNPDQVLRRLVSMAKTVKIVQATETKPTQAVAETSAEAPAETPKN